MTRRPTSDQLNLTNTIELREQFMQSKLHYAITERVVKPTIFSCKSMANIPKQQKEGRN